MSGRGEHQPLPQEGDEVEDIEKNNVNSETETHPKEPTVDSKTESLTKVNDNSTEAVDKKASSLPPAFPPDRNAEEDANLFTFLTFSYLNPLFRKGYQTTLEHSDLGIVAKQDRTDLLYVRFYQEWLKEKQIFPKSKRSLWFTLWRTVGYHRLFLAIFLYAIYTAESFGPILILNRLVQHFQGTAELSTAGLWICVSLMFVLPMTASMFAAHSTVILYHVGLQFRNSLVNMIYRKALILSPSARQGSSTGQIVNMFSNDTQQIQRFLFFVNNMSLAIPTIIVCLILIYQQVGPATFVGLGLIIFIMPINAMIFMLLGRLRRRKVVETDGRVKLMNEILNGIRIIKYYAWEAAFEKKVGESRNKELVILKQMAYVVAIAFTIVLQAVPVFLPVLIFLTYVKLGNRLDAATAFTTISLFNLMQFPFVFLPMGFSQYSQSLVSTQRMLTFFDAEELHPYVNNEVDENEPDVVISLKDCSLGWIDEETSKEIQEKKEKQEQNGKGRGKGNENHQKNNEKKVAENKTYTAVSNKEESADKDLNAVDGTTGDIELQLQNKSGEEQDKKLINRSVNTLSNINLKIHKGQLVAVVGSVGSGKSSFLSGLLGEMLYQQGEVRVSTTNIAYCDQRPWILNDTLKENILFGLPYDEERFDQAMYAANLEDDVKILPGGIETQIGERGINLSGGQKARVALARAVYRQAELYLLDDPLSAVDADVSQFLFHQCICQVLNGKTRVLVTHQLHYLNHCDLIVILEQGVVKAVGKYDELMASGIDLAMYLPVKKKAEEEKDGKKKKKDKKNANGKTDEKDVGEGEDDSIDTDESESEEDKEKEVNKAKAASKESEKALEKWKAAAATRKQDNRSSTIISKEERTIGDVTSAVYSYYIKAGGLGYFFSFVAFILIGQAFSVLGSYWLQYWGTTSVKHDKQSNPLSSTENLFYLQIFAALACASLLAYVLRSLLLANHRLGTSVTFHQRLLESTLYAPISFFDTTPTGRILNRFSSDMLSVDEELSQTLSQASNSLAQVLGAFGAIVGATKGTFLLVMIPLAYFYYQVQRYFRNTNTTIARLESISRSPIYADFSQALTGLPSIRAYRDTPRFIGKLEAAINHNSIANVSTQLCSQWLALRLDFMGALVSFFIATIAAATYSSNRGSEFIPAGFVAVGLTYSFQLTTYLKFLIRMIASGEAQMNSIERIKYYMDNIPREGAVKAETTEMIEAPQEWPARGEIQAEHISMRYRNEGPLVLKDIDFTVKAGEKIGIAGRTGSGKSSLMVALFRIEELAGGRILIDGIDISQLSLTALRSKLGIIPQDPVMFSASVRFNLDPFDLSSDAELWQVLEQVQMKDHVTSLPKKLSELVSEGGENFSAGQRQLLCIARALLRKPKILVLDEATASIDNETDALIQKMIREQFHGHCTVLTIAHRLHTIMDSDRVMVLDSGNIVEFDSPQHLLNQEAQGEGEVKGVSTSVFRRLWEKHSKSHNHH